MARKRRLDRKRLGAIIALIPCDEPGCVGLSVNNGTECTRTSCKRNTGKDLYAQESLVTSWVEV